MPELAEVLYYSRQWDAGLGRRIARVHVRAASRVFRGGNPGAIAALAGATYRRSAVHGKNMLFEFSGEQWLGGHLGMTGELLAGPPDHVPERHDHLVLYTGEAALIYRDPRMFGRWRHEHSLQAPGWWQALPAEILSRKFTLEHVAGILTRRARSPLKPLLLDQSLFPGIGNWMADEALWQLRLPPSAPAGQCPAGALHRVLQKITRTAVRTIGRDWSDPPRTWLFQHRWKAGRHCPRCGTALSRGDFRGRTACWCPQCQAA